MTTADRLLYHQIHPLKLLVDWSSAFVAAALFWQHRATEAWLVGFAPSIVVSIALIRWTSLEPYRDSRLGCYVAGFMTRKVEAARFAGLIPLWGGAWVHRGLVMVIGVLWIAGCWLSGLVL